MWLHYTTAALFKTRNLFLLLIHSVVTLLWFVPALCATTALDAAGSSLVKVGRSGVARHLLPPLSNPLSTYLAGSWYF